MPTSLAEHCRPTTRVRDEQDFADSSADLARSAYATHATVAVPGGDIRGQTRHLTLWGRRR